jgi:SAM-dependent methyltransferase
LAEFTGERVIPGLVDENLFNEHLARYRFAARFVTDGHVLDAGCGSGYGAAEFSRAASITAADISAEAVRHARQNFARPGIRFLQASCEVLPFAGASFDLVTAFEVIEHLPRWPLLLEEASRVLKHTGVLLVSTPNKSYYAEARGTAGPNPFHCHEFEYAEFEAALYAVFPHVRMWTQNHSEAIVFAPCHPDAATLHANGDASPDTAHFFVAACSHSAIALNEVHAWVPASANLLREREHHIARLEGELAKKDSWLNETLAAHADLQNSHEATLAELKQRNEWAQRLNQEIADRRAAITRLQQEATDNLAWIRNLEAQIAEGDAEILRLSEVSTSLETDLAARTAWARKLEAELVERTAHVRIQSEHIAELIAHVERQGQGIAELQNERSMIAGSKWIRLGRKLHLGPVLEDSTAGGE